MLVEHLREDFHDTFAFALLGGIRETGLCTLEHSKVALVNAQVTFQSKRHRGDPPGFIRWEIQASGPLELALLTEIMAAKHHAKRNMSSPTSPAARRAGPGRTPSLKRQALPDHAGGADRPLAT